MAKKMYKVTATMTYETVVEAYDEDDADFIAGQISPNRWDEKDWLIDGVECLYVTNAEYYAPDRNDE